TQALAMPQPSDLNQFARLAPGDAIHRRRWGVEKYAPEARRSQAQPFQDRPGYGARHPIAELIKCAARSQVAERPGENGNDLSRRHVEKRQPADHRADRSAFE